MSQMLSQMSFNYYFLVEQLGHFWALACIYANTFCLTTPSTVTVSSWTTLSKLVRWFKMVTEQNILLLISTREERHGKYLASGIRLIYTDYLLSIVLLDDVLYLSRFRVLTYRALTHRESSAI